jgi:hypothetical protein
MQIIIEPGGTLRCIYTEDINLAALGNPTITRASHVEPDQQGRWQADLTPVGGPVLAGFAQRSEALAAEQAWLEAHWLVPNMEPVKKRRLPKPSNELFA